MLILELRLRVCGQFGPAVATFHVIPALVQISPSGSRDSSLRPGDIFEKRPCGSHHPFAVIVSSAHTSTSAYGETLSAAGRRFRARLKPGKVISSSRENS